MCQSLSKKQSQEQEKDKRPHITSKRGVGRAEVGEELTRECRILEP